MRHSLRFKLLGAFAAVVALMVLTGVIAISALGNLNKNADLLGSDSVPGLQTAGDLNGWMNKIRKDQIRYAVGIDKQARADAGTDLADDNKQFATTLDKHKAAPSDATDARLTAALGKALTDYETASGGYRAAADHGDKVGATAAITTGAGDHAYDGLKTALTNFNAHQTKLAAQRVDSASSSYSSGRTLVVLLLIVAALVAVSIALLLARGIVRSMNELVKAADGIAEGDIDQTIEVNARTRSARPRARSAA